MSKDVLRPRDKWNQWTTEEIEKYIKKHSYHTGASNLKFSNHRRKKIKFLRGILAQRERAAKLLGM